MKSFLNSFINAAYGIWFCVRYERNFRIHLIAAAYALGFAPLFSLSQVEWAVLLLTIAIVLVAEAINTAVEHTVDLLSPKTHPAARIAKDTAAAAVLVCTVVSIVVGVLIFGRPDMLLQVFKNILSSPKKFVILAVSLVFSLWFIIKGGHKKHPN